MKEFNTANPNKMKVLDINTFGTRKGKRQLRTSISLPSQYSNYAICVEIMRDWFLSKFPHHFFNSVYVDGTHSFDEFRKFSHMDDRLKRSNPLLAIVPEIDLNHNRNWIDSTPEYPFFLRRALMENIFFKDERENKGLYLQLLGETISMNFLFKIRLDTYAEELDMIQYLKLKHKAGWSYTGYADLDVNVPKGIISQIAWDNNIKMNKDNTVVDPIEMLSYLNQYSVCPFLYKLRCSTGNKEFFIKVPDCSYLIMPELPSGDRGERHDHVMKNYIVEFPVNIEMTAPYCFTYYSQTRHDFIKPTNNIGRDKEYVCVEVFKKTDVPVVDEHGWRLLTDEPLRYEVDDEDLGTEVDIDFLEQFENTDLGAIIQFNIDTYIAPEICINFKIFNDGDECKWSMDWNTLKMHIHKELTANAIVIAIYTDNKYINDTSIYLKDLQNESSRH